MRREIFQKRLTILSVSRIRTRAVTFSHHGQQLSVLSLSWVIADFDKVEWDRQQIRYSHWCQKEEYISVLEIRPLDLQTSYTEQSVVRCVTRIEKYFRGKAVELGANTSRSSATSWALLRARKELESKWELRRDFLTLRSGNRTLKGDGRGRGVEQDVGGKGFRDRWGEVKAELWKMRYEAEMTQPVVPPSLKLRRTSCVSQQKSCQFSTCTRCWTKTSAQKLEWWTRLQEAGRWVEI